MAFGELMIIIKMLAFFTCFCLSQVNEADVEEVEEALVVSGNDYRTTACFTIYVKVDLAEAEAEQLAVGVWLVVCSPLKLYVHY
jgi:hypothetical protein